MGAHPVWCQVGARGINDSACQHILFTRWPCNTQQERSCRPALSLHHILTDAGDSQSTGMELQVTLDLFEARERSNKPIQQFTTRWILVLRWWSPTIGQQKLGRLLVHVELPWREHLHMRPFFNTGPSFRTGFQNQRSDTSGQQMGSSGEAHRACSNDGDGKMIVFHDRFLLQAG
ncbi:hypothetical protein D3C76_1283940 [compost metagenome]